MNIWTDICVNLTNKRFVDDYHQVINDALEAGIRRIVITGTNLEHSFAAAKLCESYPRNLRCTVGCHPHDAKQMTPDKWELLEALLDSPFVVAVGECGLDFDRNFSDPDQQIEVFIRQLEMAIDHECPVFLHERDAHKEMLGILHHHRHNLDNLVLHCFTGDEEQLSHYLELDMYIGITGWICDERRNHSLVNALPMIPNDRLMIETDSPYLLPRTLKNNSSSNRNEPKHLIEVGRAVADIRGVDLATIATITTLNSYQFFHWPIDVNDLVNISHQEE